jgi:hypothetical protein
MALVTACAFAVDGVTLINQSTLNAAGGTYTITQAGSYKLSGNLQVKDENTTAILITADNVTIDLNGFSILGPTVCVGTPVASCSPTGTGNGVDGGTQNSITVVNGNVRGMGHSGIFLGGNSSYGVFLGGYGGYVEKVHADSNGVNGITVGTGGTVSGNTTNSNGGPCCASAGIIAGSGSTVSGNTSHFNRIGGIIAFCPSSVVGNTVTVNAVGNLATPGAGCAVANNAAP